MPKIVSSTTLRDNFSDAIKALSKKEKYLIVSKKGRPISALVNLDFFEDLLALSSLKYKNSIREARKNYSQGKVFSHDEVFGTL